MPQKVFKVSSHQTNFWIQYWFRQTTMARVLTFVASLFDYDLRFFVINPEDDVLGGLL